MVRIAYPKVYSPVLFSACMRWVNENADPQQM
jgi:hypothetical protein